MVHLLKSISNVMWLINKEQWFLCQVPREEDCLQPLEWWSHMWMIIQHFIQIITHSSKRWQFHPIFRILEIFLASLKKYGITKSLSYSIFRAINHQHMARLQNIDKEQTFPRTPRTLNPFTFRGDQCFNLRHEHQWSNICGDMLFAHLWTIVDKKIVNFGGRCCWLIEVWRA